MTMAKRITESDRRRVAWEMIEEISSNAQSTCPKETWQESHDAVCEIYMIAHAIRAIKCRKSHPSWCNKIDDAVLAERRGSK